MKKTILNSVGERYDLFCGNKEQRLNTRERLQVANTTPFNSLASGGHWMQTFPILKFLNYLKLLWKGYAERQQYQKEVQKRLLKQRAIRRPKAESIKLKAGEQHWTDRYLKYQTLSIKYQEESSKGILLNFNNWLRDGGFWSSFAFSWCKGTRGLSRRSTALGKASLLTCLLTRQAMTRWGERGSRNEFGMTKWKYGMTVLSLMMLSVNVKAQETTRPLKIGDSLPDLTFENVQYYKDNTLKLSDFKGKLVILDFWATWCSPCVAMIPKMDSLQQEFEGKVQFISVGYQTRKVVLDYLLRLEKDRGFKIHVPQITDDTHLAALFPHRSLPHYVWIDQKGIIVSITGYEEINRANIHTVLKQSTGGLVQKRDFKSIPYDAAKPLFIGVNGGSPNPLYHRVFTGFQSGLNLSFRMQQQGDSLMVITAANQTILNLYAMAYSNGKGIIPRKRVLIDVKHPELLNSETHGQPYRDWMAKGNVFCYELRLPLAAQSKAFALMQQDMDLLFPQLLGKLETRKMPCLVLEATGDSRKYLTKGGDPAMRFDLSSAFMKNAYVNHLLIRLDNYNLARDSRTVINGLGNEVRVDLDLQCSLSDVKALNKALAAYGLALVEREKDMEVLVISDRKGAKL